MTLWIILTALTALAAAWLTIPLVRRHEARVDARAATIAVLKDQLADVDVQVAAGSVQPGEAEGLRNEIRRRLLAAGHIPTELNRSLGQGALSGLALGLAAMVAVAGAAMYASMGQPELGGSNATSAAASTVAPAAAPPSAQGAAAQGEVAQLVAGLEQKMQATPNDPEGWRMLGWSYFQTARYADAAKAYERAIALKPGGEGYQSAYGEALVQEAGGQVTPAAAAAFEKAAAQDGADARARYFLAVRKAESGDRKNAVEDMLRLLADSPADAPWLSQLRGVIQQTAQAAGIDIAARLAATKPVGNAAVPGLPPQVAAAAAANAAAPAGVMPSPSRDQVQAAQAMKPGDRQAMIRGMVDGLAQKLKANPNDEAGWLRLMRARQVLGDVPAARTARDQALAAFAGDVAAQGRIRAAGAEMGL